MGSYAPFGKRRTKIYRKYPVPIRVEEETPSPNLEEVSYLSIIGGLTKILVQNHEPPAGLGKYPPIGKYLEILLSDIRQKFHHDGGSLPHNPYLRLPAIEPQHRTRRTTLPINGFAPKKRNRSPHPRKS